MEACGDDVAEAFRRYQSMRCVRTARVTFESRLLWEVYHAADLERDALWQGLTERSEADVYRCLAWLYDGISPPQAA
jgi:salicylate hydroxylase